jgi:hypothetical protein
MRHSRLTREVPSPQSVTQATRVREVGESVENSAPLRGLAMVAVLCSLLVPEVVVAVVVCESGQRSAVVLVAAKLQIHSWLTSDRLPLPQI